MNCFCGMVEQRWAWRYFRPGPLSWVLAVAGGFGPVRGLGLGFGGWGYAVVVASEPRLLGFKLLNWVLQDISLGFGLLGWVVGAGLPFGDI